jgi:hypothetical protein
LINAGGDYVDELRNLIGKTTDFNGIPDNNIIDIGFHYFNWYYVNAGDGDCSFADMDDNNTIDLRNFALLADGWETTYDMNNLKTMADEWMRVAEPNIQLQIVGDGNNGFIEVGAEGYTSNTQRIFMLVDGQYVGEILWFREGWPLEFDASELGPGIHQLKAVSIDAEGRVTCSGITENAFNCFMNYCLYPKFYEPNKTIHFYGFYPGGDIYVKAFEYGKENPLWSEVYSGGNLSGFIPAEVTAANDIDYVEFKDISNGMSATKPIEKKSDPNSSVRALLILVDFAVNRTNEGVIDEVRETFRSHHIRFDELGCWGSTGGKIKEYAEKGSINFIYYCGHGEYKDGFYRTRVEINGGLLYSFKPSDVGGFDLYEMGFKDITFAYFDCCYSAHLVYDKEKKEFVEGREGFMPYQDGIHSDMSLALRMDSEGNHFYQGWYSPRPTGMVDYMDLGPNVKNPYHYFSLYEWQKLREGASLHVATDYAINKMAKFLYGDHAKDNFRMRGKGNIWEVKIE